MTRLWTFVLILRWKFSSRWKALPITLIGSRSEMIQCFDRRDDESSLEVQKKTKKKERKVAYIQRFSFYRCRDNFLSHEKKLYLSLFCFMNGKVFVSLFLELFIFFSSIFISIPNRSPIIHTWYFFKLIKM